MRVLVTGGFGFAGRHLVRHLVECGEDVAVTYHPPTEEAIKETVHDVTKPGQIALPSAVQSFALDVTDKKAVDQLIAVTKPDAICHLAALASVPGTENTLDQVMNVNLQGSINIFEAVAKHSRNSRVLFVSSSEVYGEPRPGTLPLTEVAELRPVTTYGWTKSAADIAAFKYAVREKLDIVRARPFPHTGPGQKDIFAISSFARQIAEIKLGKVEPVVSVGNLDAKRDYTDVSDIVRGYREVLLNGVVGNAYNLCSGKSHQIKELLALLIKASNVEVEVKSDPSRLRSLDIAESYGSYAKAQKEFGWKPRVELSDTLSSLIAYWMEFLPSL